MSYQPPFTVTAEIIDLISKISMLLGEVNHLNNSSNAMRLRRISKIKTITGTLQIEGNTLDEKQITAFLEGKLVMGSEQELAEVRGAISAYDDISRFDYKNVNHLLKAHKLMMGEILINAGKFRDNAVGVFGADG